MSDKNEGKDKDAIISQYTADFKNKQRVKFPWTTKEIEKALNHFTKLILKLLINDTVINIDQLTNQFR